MKRKRDLVITDDGIIFPANASIPLIEVAVLEEQDNKFETVEDKDGEETFEFVIRTYEGDLIRVRKEGLEDGDEVLACRAIDELDNAGEWQCENEELVEIREHHITGDDFPPELSLFFAQLSPSAIIEVFDFYSEMFLASEMEDTEIVEEIKRLYNNVVV